MKFLGLGLGTGTSITFWAISIVIYPEMLLPPFTKLWRYRDTQCLSVCLSVCLLVN